MDWPVESPPISDAETRTWQLYYQGACPTPSDPTMVWGTDVETGGLDAYLQAVNAEGDVLISPVTVLVRAVGLALRRHPALNRRLISRRVYQYRHAHVLLSLRNSRSREVATLLLEDPDRRSLADIARELWRAGQMSARGELVNWEASTFYDRIPRWFVRRYFWMHLWFFNTFNFPVTRFWRREHRASVLINYLGFRGAPPLRMYKPSRFPSDATPVSVTLGAAEQRPVAHNGQIVVRPLAPLFVRADHRVIDAHDLGLFVETVRGFLAEPVSMDRPADSLPATRAA